MRLLLIQTPTSHLGAGEKVYPLGLARLTGVVPKNIEIQGLDMNLHADPWPVLKETLLEFRPDLAAISFRNIDPLAGHHASYLSSLKTTAHLIRNALPKIRIIAGGPAFSLFAERLMIEVPELDAGIAGEAEAIFPALLSGGDMPANLPGMAWRNNRRIIQNPLGQRVNLDTLPALNTSIFRPEHYLKGNKYVAAIGIEGKRGCNLCCAYCVYPHLGGKKMRLRSPVKIVDEMELLKKEYGAELFHFTDSVLNRPVDHFEAVCREILRRELKVGWTGFFREENLTHALVRLAMQAGLAAIYFSGDALTDKGLATLAKGLEKEDLLRAARITADCGILTMCHFLVNLPGEDESQAREARGTLDRLLDIHAPAANLGAVIFNTVRLYPNAPLTRRLQRCGEIDPDPDLLYPVYFNPPKTAHRLHQLEAHCHLAGVLSRLEVTTRTEDD